MKKKLLILVPIVLVILIGIFVGLYFTTDLFKSPKTLFYKYAQKSIQPLSTLSYDDFLETQKASQEKSFVSNSKLSIDMDLGKALPEKVDNIFKNLEIAMVQTSDVSKEQTSLDLTLKYKDTDVTNFKYINKDNTFYLKNDDFYKSYIGLENSNLKEFAERLEIDSTHIPDSINDIDIYELLYIDKKTRDSIKSSYLEVIDKSLKKDQFKTEKGVEIKLDGKKIKTTTHTLTLNSKDFYNILIKLAKQLEKDDELLDLIIEKYNLLNASTFINSDLEFTKNTIKDALSATITDLESTKDYYSGSSGKIRIILHSYKGDTVRLSIKSNSDTINLDFIKDKKDKNSGTLILSQSVNKKETVISKIDYTFINTKEHFKLYYKTELFENGNLDLNDFNFNFDTIEFLSESKGKATEGNVTKNMYISMIDNDSNQYIKINYDETLEWDKTGDIEDVTSDNSLILNSATDEELNNLINDIVTNANTFLEKITEIFKVDFKDMEIDSNNPLNNLNITTNTNNNSEDLDDFDFDFDDFDLNDLDLNDLNLED